jgi:glyoxylase-like metal-dependent hydrolase (beta-lactamase superfamily II)
MIKISQVEQLIQIRMGREVNGTVPYATAAYLIDGLLIDTGPGHTATELAQALEGRYVKLAVNTHHHEDHIGGNAILMRKFGIEILASCLSAPIIRQGPKMYALGEEAWGVPEPTEVGRLPETIETDHFRFDVMDTPGHCHGHVALVEPTRGWCLSGDLYVPWEPTRYRRGEEDLIQTIRSMEKLIGLKTEKLVLLTSVGRIVQDGRSALRSRIEYYQKLARRARQLEKKGLSVVAIRDELFGGESPIAEATGGDISSEHLVEALLSAEI